jgi:phospholipase/carboxylesterase
MSLTAHALLPAAGGKPTGLVVFLHGVGSNGKDLIALAPMWAEALPGVLFVSPDAPDACDMSPGYPDSFQWFSLADRDPSAMWRGVSAAAPTVDAFLDDLLASHGLPDERLALVGFSQGTMTALHMLGRRPRPLAAVVGYSGALLQSAGSSPNAEAYGASQTPVLLVHGDDDGVVPVAALPRAEAVLKGQGFAVETLICPGVGHTIDPRGLTAGRDFLARRMA